MLTLELIETLKQLILCLIVYFPTVTLSGFFEAWIAKKLGDDVPEQFGYLNFNPLVHFSFVGFTCLILGNVFSNYFPVFRGLPGWGQYIPLNPQPYPWYYNVLEFLARGLAHFVLLIIALFTLVVYVKIDAQSSALMLSLQDVLRFFLEQNLILAGVYLSIGTARIIFQRFFPNFYVFQTENFFVALGLIFGTVFLVSMAIQTILPFLIFCIYSLLLH